MSDTDKHFADLRNHSTRLAELLRSNRQQRAAIASAAHDKTYSAQHNAGQAAQKRAALAEQSNATLEALKQQRQQAQEAIRRAHAKASPAYDRATLDSAWQRVKPLLDAHAPDTVFRAMQTVAQQPPEVRAAVKDGLSLYLAGRASPNAAKQAHTTALAALEQHEAPYLTETEKQIRREAKELADNEGLLDQAESYAAHELTSGHEAPMLASWGKTAVKV